MQLNLRGWIVVNCCWTSPSWIPVVLRMELCLAPRRIRVNHLFPNTSILLILYAQTIILEEVSAKVPYKPTLRSIYYWIKHNNLCFHYVLWDVYLYEDNKENHLWSWHFVLQAICLEYAVLLHMGRKGLESYLNVLKKI